jgi:microsomal dipeptidase-like Zn-dependent dipeptidase
MRCPACDKIQYDCKADAERAIRVVKKHPYKGHGLRLLNAYKCAACGAYHVGHRRTIQATAAPAVPAPPSFADLRRKLKRMQAEWDRHDDRLRRKQAAAILRRVADDKRQTMLESENARAIISDLADLADSYAQALRIMAATVPDPETLPQ